MYLYLREEGRLSAEACGPGQLQAGPAAPQPPHGLSVCRGRSLSPRSPQRVLVRGTGTQLGHVMQAHEQAGLARAGDGGHEAGGFAFYALTLVVWQQLKIHSFRINDPLRERGLQRPPKDSLTHQPRDKQATAELKSKRLTRTASSELEGKLTTTSEPGKAACLPV